MMPELNKERLRLQREVRERTVGYVLAAFGLIAGLAWNEAAKALIEYLFPFATGSLFGKFLYAIIITIVVVLLSTYLVRLFHDRDEQKEQ